MKDVHKGNIQTIVCCRPDRLTRSTKDGFEFVEEPEQILQEQNIQAQSFEVLRDMLKSFADTMDDITAEQKRLALRLLVKNIVWDGEQVRIYLLGGDGPGESGDGIDLPPPDDVQD